MPCAWVLATNPSSTRLAMAEARQGACLVCHIHIPPQMYNELQRVDRLKNCPNCERIIYWDEEQSRSE